MKGLILKDLLVLKQQAKVYLAILALWGFVSIRNGNFVFFAGFLCIFTLLLPMSAIAYDEQCHWDSYALTMPVSRVTLVLSKYVLALLTALCAVLITVAVGLAAGVGLAESLIVAAGSACVTIVVTSVIIPVIFKYGAIKGRLVMLLIVLVPVIIGTVFQGAAVELPAVSAGLMALLLPLCALLALSASAAVSVGIMKKKEF